MWHEKLLFQRLRLDRKRISAHSLISATPGAWPADRAAIGIEQGIVESGDKVALLGIGSGINVVMLALEWNKTLCPEEVPGLFPSE